MIEPLTILWLFASCLVASLISAVAGFGGALILLPALTWAFGARDAVPIVTVLQLVGNATRVAFNRSDVKLPVVGWFSLGAIPAAVIGGLIFVASPQPILKGLIGGFLILVVILRRWPGSKLPTMRRGYFAPVGFCTSFLSAIIGSAGPVTAPFFLSYGLSRGAFIGTEALSAFVTHLMKIAVYAGTFTLTGEQISIGSTLSIAVILGSYVGKGVIDRLNQRVFTFIVEAILIACGLQMLFGDIPFPNADGGRSARYQLIRPTSVSPDVKPSGEHAGADPFPLQAPLPPIGMTWVPRPPELEIA